MNAQTKPLAPGMRRITYRVENGCGDIADVTLDIPFDVTPRQRAGVAIFRARNVLPNEKPWRCIGHTEEAA